MGKWITRCNEKNTETNAISNTSSIDIVESNFEPASMDPVRTTHGDHRHSPVLDHLTETERQAYHGWYEVMTGKNFNMSQYEAHAEARKLLLKTSRLLKIEQALKDYKLDGYLKIFSTKLNREIYLARDGKVKSRVPDKSLQVFLESEIETLKGLNPDELMLMLEAKAILNFNGLIEGGDQHEK